MKRIGNLYDKIYDWGNLVLAESKARQGKTHKYGVKKFDKNPTVILKEIQDSLRQETFKTSEYKLFTIREPKERLIYKLPYFPDRIVHHAIMNILEPIWKPLFISQTYSSIQGRGVHKAVNELKPVLKKYRPKYCLKLDITKFYPSIDHDILKEIIRRKLKDEKLLRLLDSIIDSAPGVPIGNYLSQYLANLYLTYFDHWVKEVLGIKFYIRYADDIVILSDSKKWLWEIFGKLKEYLEVRLKLKVKPNYQVFPIESRGIDFLGYVFYYDYTKLRKSIKLRMFRACNKPKSIASYMGWLKYCNSSGLTRKLKKNMKRKYDKLPNTFIPWSKTETLVNFNIHETEKGGECEADSIIVLNENLKSVSGLIVELIRRKYTVNDELGILRQRDAQPEEFADYNEYVENCKQIAKEIWQKKE